MGTQALSFQQLVNPGLGAGVSAQSGIANLIANQLRNRNNLQNTALAQTGAGIREELQGNRDMEKTQAQLMLDRQEAEQTAALMGITLPEGSLISPTTLRGIYAGGLSPSTQARIISNLGGAARTASELGSNAVDPLTQNFEKRSAEFGGSPVNPQAGGGMGMSPQPAGMGPQTQGGGVQQASMPNASGAFPLNVSVGASDRQLNPVERRSQAQASIAETKAKSEGLNLRDKEQQVGNEGFANLDYMNKNGAVDFSGAKLGVTPNEYNTLLRNQKAFAILPAEKKSAVAGSISTSVNDLQLLDKYTKDFLSLRSKNKGMIDRGRVNLALSGKLPFDQLTPVEEAAVNLKSIISKMALSESSKLQGGTGISNKDVEGMEKAIGDPSSQLAIAKKSLSKTLANGYLGTLRQASMVDADAYDQVKNELETFTGKPFSLNDQDNLNTWAGAVESKMGISGGITQDGRRFVRVAQPSNPVQQATPRAKTSSPRAVSTGTLSTVDKWRQLYGG
jgi:hypothetical protein